MSLILLFLRLVHSVCKFVVSFGLVVAWCCWLDCWLALSFYLLALVVSFYLLIGVVVLFVGRFCCCLGWFMLCFAAVV